MASVGTSWRSGTLMRVLAGGLLGLLIAVPCHPQAVDTAQPPSTAPAQVTEDCDGPAAGDAEPCRTDLYDLLARLRRKDPPPGDRAPQEPEGRVEFTIVPTIGSKPSSGFSIGAGASLEFLLGPLERTRVSQLNVGASVSTKKHVKTSVSGRLYGDGNRWYFDGDNHFKLTGADTYALGTDFDADPLLVNYRSTRFFDTLYWQLRGALYGGIGFVYARQTDMEPHDGSEASWDESAFVRYSTRYGFDLQEQTAAGPSINLVFDNRDSGIDPTRGWYLASTYRAYFKGLAGGDSTWQELFLDARTYEALTGNRRHKLAFWLYGDLVTGGVAPYFSLPSTGGDPQGRSGRGYAEGRFRGEQLVYGEVEYRATITRNGLLGAVVFANATTVSDRAAGERLFDAVAPAAGFGLRLLLQKRSRTNLALDFGWGRDGSSGVYLTLGEAF